MNMCEENRESKEYGDEMSVIIKVLKIQKQRFTLKNLAAKSSFVSRTCIYDIL